MKLKASIILMFIAAITLIAGGNIIKSFTATSNGDEINVEWTVSDDSNIHSFTIERASGSSESPHFINIGEVNADGRSNSYNFKDTEAYKTHGSDENSALGNTIYSYRLRINHKDNNHTYSNTIYVTHEVSGIKRTWGMIKEMFR